MDGMGSANRDTGEALAKTLSPIPSREALEAPTRQLDPLEWDKRPLRRHRLH